MEKNSVWDEEKLQKLKSLWDEGLPITKIGLELGVSRNAIAGKAHRLGLPKRNSPISKSGEPRKTQVVTNNESNKELPLKISLRKVGQIWLLLSQIFLLLKKLVGEMKLKIFTKSLNLMVFCSL